ncbi:MAG TPA: hypothetical protein VGV61_08720 [Thermoanaerobaculia bacterium]|jgi:hypothetical protein|nr:hypothetical protein [Thermoanaerobaculia bacterium]
MRRRLKQAALAVLLLAALALVALNVALNAPYASRAFSPHPDRFRIDWRSAWSVVPGHVHLRGLRLEKRTTRVAWTLTVDRLSGRIDLPALLHRDFHVLEVRGEGVRSELQRRDVAGPARPRQRGTAGRWTLRFDRIVLDHVRQLRFSGLRVVGDGRAEGGLRIALGGVFRLAPSRLRMAGAELAMGSRILTRHLDLTANASLGPYVPRQHPGLEAWDFVSGALAATGELEDLPWLAAGAGSRRKPGELAATLRIAGGRLEPGSRLRVAADGPRPASSFALTAAIVAAPGAHLSIDVATRGLNAGGSPARPVLQVADLELATATPETRLRQLILAVRSRRPVVSTSAPVMADVRAAGVRIDAPSSRLALRATLDRAAARVDLGALLARDVVAEGLEVDGAKVALELGHASRARSATPEPWGVRLDGARLTRIHEVALGDLRLAGEGSAETSLSLDRAGTLAVPRATVSMAGGRLEIAGRPAASALGVELAVHLDPVIAGPDRGRQLLRATSGDGTLRGQVVSLGFLTPYLEKTPWLKIAGQGAFTADLRLEHGRFAAGSRLAISSDPVVATILASQASGRGTLEVGVEPGPAGPRTAMRLRFDRFGLADLRRADHPPYLRGRGLSIVAIAAKPVDLGDPVQDFDATLDLPEAEVPDLAVYDSLLPAEAGLSILGGRGRARLHLQASTASRRASGSTTLRAEGARLRFQNLDLEGRLTLRAPLSTPDIMGHRFDLAGTRLEVADVTYRDATGDREPPPPGWWARGELSRGSLLWGDPLSLRGEARVTMKDSGPLLTLFAQKSRLLRWFEDALRVEGVTATASVRLDPGLVVIDDLRATGGSLEVRSRMRFARQQRRGELYLRYGRLAAGVELRDGERTLQLRHPLEWFESAGRTP